ncbi:ABC transporter substrate-binding protein [Roseixanthobacter pseudopolyaromaticivorans]|uniref:ABC transporter substrate-binding protein n=1 Tax=Xanthobacteraceae TaxID=335928 RepID=UPI00372C2648
MRKLLRFTTATFLLACASTTLPAAAQTTPIKIGFANSFSPPGNVIGGRESKVGGEIALDMFKAQFGPKVDGRDIEIIYEDTRGDPEASRSAMEKLVNRDKVDVVVGCNHSSEGFVLSRIAHENKVGFVAMNCWADDIRQQKFPEVFAVSNYTSRTSYAVTNFVKQQGVKSFLMVAENTDYGLAQIKMIEADLKRDAPDVKVSTKIINKTSRDMRDEILSIRQNPPDLIGVAMVAPQGFLFTAQLDELGMPPSEQKVIDIGGYVDQAGFWDNVKGAGVGLYAYVLDHKSNPVTELGAKVQAEYRKRTNQDPTRFILQGFDTTWVALMAIKESGGKSREAIIQALRKIRVVGSRGEIFFTDEPLFQQWPNIPFVVGQMEKVGQPPSESKVVFPPPSSKK